MHERDRSERRFPDRSAGEREPRRVVDGHSPDGGELHEQIVRMLSIAQRSTVERFACLEDFAIPVLADRGGVETQHARERQSPMRSGPTRHPHPPVRDDEFVAAARSALVIELREHNPVLHELPALTHVHLHVFVLGRRIVGRRGSSRTLGSDT
ncbi:MAG TPA: hypothetical protein VFP91_11745 [Vicinamibacterales bacterium]|nr:hypothetical protein [Vicinamibacterales bacterium]